MKEDKLIIKREKYARRIVKKILKLSEKLNDIELAYCIEIQTRILMSHIIDYHNLKKIMKQEIKILKGENERNNN